MAIRPEQFDRLAERLPGIGRDPASVRARIEAMEQLLERVVTLPVLRRKVGLDAILGLVPVVGDVATAAMGAWLVWEARNLGMSKLTIARMIANIGVDTAIGAVPVVGDAVDLFFRSNTRNLRLIRRHLDKHHPSTVTLEGLR